ncbi:MAG: L-histidine N(alpha)-methyltransferase, partial [Acetobacteraceae bacterium]
MPDDSMTLAERIDPDLCRIALEGLLGTLKTLPAKLFYDDEGCRLFYRITELPEYYLTRTELALL